HRYSCRHPSSNHIYPLSLHDALPIYQVTKRRLAPLRRWRVKSVPTIWRPSSWSPSKEKVASSSRPKVFSPRSWTGAAQTTSYSRSEEHTSELQSRFDLVCRLLLEKKK